MTLISALPNKTPDDGDKILIDQAGSDGYLTRAQIVATVAADILAEEATRISDVATLTADKLDLSGGTLTGALTLAGAPTASSHAATKNYVDTIAGTKASTASPTLTGVPTSTTAALGTNTTQIATTAFVIDEIEGQLFNRTEITAATHILTESETGLIAVDRAGTVGITLPAISSLTSPTKVRYHIKDEGFNANSTTQKITITRSGADSIENGSTTTTITTPGETVVLYNDGVSGWFIDNVDTSATETSKGVVNLATQAETLGLTEASKVVTPATLSSVIDNRVYKALELGAPSKVLVEADAGLWYVSYTNTASVSISLPDPSSLVDVTKTVYEITDIGDAGTNNITITSLGGATINGSSTFVISNARVGTKLFTDGANWFTTANTQEAVTAAVAAAAVAASPLTTKGDIYTYTTTDAKLAVGADGTVLTADSAEATGMKWVAPAAGAFLPLAGGTMTGAILMAGDYIDFGQTHNNRIGTLGLDKGFSFSSSFGTGAYSVWGAAQYTFYDDNSSTGDYMRIDAANNALEHKDITGGFSSSLQFTTPTANRVITLQDEDGTVALTSDLSGLTTKTIATGDWDMDADFTLLVPHGLSATEYKTIRSFNCVVRNDADSIYANLAATDGLGGVEGGINQANATDITLFRTTGGSFDSTSWDSTGFNRGWVTIEYTKD